MSQYLWDKTGLPDREIEDLEQRLAPLRLRQRVPVLPRARAPRVAIAAAVALCALSLKLLSTGAPQPSAWAIADADGRAVAVRVGQTLQTNSGATLTLEHDDVGQVNLGPGSKLTVQGSSRGREVMNLEHGQLHALIWAPPQRFVVDTPSARTIDLGCEYDLSVDERGDGVVHVRTGWVAFQFGERESFIPAGAACRTSRVRGPGVPYFEDASEPLRQALEQYESAPGRPALDRVLATAAARDGLTLWHLLSRVPPDQVSLVFDRFAELVPLPPNVQRAGVLARERGALDLCWNALGLDDAEWWREWKREWRGSSER